jgi:non-heme chloroperoxidase
MTRLCAVLVVLTVLGRPTSTGAEAPKVKSFQSNGVKIAYAIKGKGEPVVLIHGWLSSALINWELPGITALLAKDFQVIEFDCRGHGFSGKPTREEAYGKELVEDVLRLLDHLKVKKAHIVGYSLGSIIACHFLAKHPDRVLSGTLGGMGWLNQVAALGFLSVPRDDPRADAKAVCFRSLNKLTLTAKEIKSIKVPVTVLVGKKDELVKKLCVQPLLTVRKDWPVVEIDGADHLTCIVMPQFKKEIHKWLTRQKQR